MAKVDIYVEIRYNAKKGKEKIWIESTNIKNKLVKDFLLDWLMTQVGQGKDERKAIKRESYKVVIGCDLSYDTFHISSDTGNDGLTCGIVMGMVNNLEK